MQFKDISYLYMNPCSKNDLVSVIIPTIGRESLLEAVTSVTAQTYRPLEVIVVYDNPNIEPDVSALTAAARDCNLVIHRNSERKGGAAARNIGISKARGEFICFLDDDDIYYPNKIQALIDILNRNPTIDAAFGKMRAFDGKNHMTRIAYPAKFSRKINLMVMNYIHNNATLIRANVLSRLKFYEKLTRFQDTQFNAELSYRFNIHFVNEHVAEWRIDPRTDRVTHDGNNKKRQKDVVNFQNLVNYLHQTIGIPKGWLVLFNLYLIRQHFSLGNYKNAFIILAQHCFLLSHPLSLLKAIHLRKTMWRGEIN